MHQGQKLLSNHTSATLPVKYISEALATFVKVSKK